MPEIQYPKNPNSDTAFVVQEDGTKNRALMTAPQDTSTLELPSNSNSTKGYVTVDGKKQRVILTADIGGGGGGSSVDYAKTVQRAETMPTANASNAGQQFLYSGESDATYTHGYIYENVTSTTPASATGTQTTGSTLSDITVDGETFWEELEEYEIPQQTGDYVFTYNGETGYWDYGDDYFDLSDFGVTYTGTPADSDVLTISVTAPSATYAWTRVDVQPAPVIPDPLPSQTGNAGKFLTTDGTNASWGNAIANDSTVSTSVVVTGTADTTHGNGVAIGKTAKLGNYSSVAIGYGADANSGQNFGVAIGDSAKVNGTSAVAIGYRVSAGAYGVAIGNNDDGTSAASYSIAIRGKATAQNAIQLGNGTNGDQYTFKVGWGSSANYTLLEWDVNTRTATIPTARLTKVNTTATLAVADWSNGSQTVTVSGVAADSVVFVSPAPASASDYASAGILCTAQAADSLTFTCTTTPSNAITVNVVCM